MSRFGSDNRPFFGYEFAVWSVYGMPPLRTHKRSKTRFGVAVEILYDEVIWLQDIQFASITSYRRERLDFGVTSSSGGGPDVVVVDPST